MSEVFVLCGDSVEILKTYPDNHFDSVVTDPPYGLSDHTPEDFTSCLQSWMAGEEFKTKKKGFMGNSWDSWVPGPELWKEVYRVLKPGGHLLAFAGSRTHDLMSVAIRLAGFSNRDTIMWVYGSGFPKSMDVSKAIDKAAGVTGSYGGKKPNAHSRGNHVQHDGWKRPWQDDPEVVDKSGREYLPQSAAARQWQGWGTALKPAYEPILMFRKPFTGTVAQNVLECGTGAINIDGCRVRSEESAVTRFPANFTHDGSEEVLGLFPDSNGAGKSLPRVKVTGYGDKNTGTGTAQYFGGDRIPFDSGSGSAARFFYSPKASKKDRGEGNTHPTVKPRELMKWLVRMVTPNGGKVLDPFGGSGTTGVACIEEGFDCVLIELDQKHVDIINNRLIECKLSLRNKLEFEE